LDQRTTVRSDYRLRLAERIPFFYGWIIVGTAFLGTFVGGGLQSFTFSVFLEPMSESLGWSRTVLTGALALRILTAASLAPLFGFVVDRYGPRFLMVASAVIGGVATLLLSRVSEIWQFYAIFAFVGISGGAGLGGVVTGATVSKWFVRLRGRALAFTTMGGPAPGLILAPVIAFVVFTYGWQAGWILMSVLFIVLLLPVSLLMARQPEDMGLLPDGAKSEDEVKETYGRRASLESQYSWRLGEALRTRTLWLLVLTQILSGLAVSSVVLHEFSYVKQLGYSTAVAAGVLSTHGGLAMAFRPVWGLMLERVPVRFAMSAVYLGTGGALLILLNASSIPMVFLFAAVYGSSVAGLAVSQAIIFPNYFGRDNVGTIRGFIMPLSMPAGALGPFLVSVAFDTKGTYFMAFTVLMFLMLVSAVIMLLVKPPVRR
jgi:MFS family permease